MHTRHLIPIGSRTHLNIGRVSTPPDFTMTTMYKMHYKKNILYQLALSKPLHVGVTSTSIAFFASEWVCWLAMSTVSKALAPSILSWEDESFSYDLNIEIQDQYWPDRLSSRDPDWFGPIR